MRALDDRAKTRHDRAQRHRRGGSAWKRGASTAARAAPCDRVQGNNSNEMGGSDGIG
jgi:hypothetical protein